MLILLAFVSVEAICETPPKFILGQKDYQVTHEQALKRLKELKATTEYLRVVNPNSLPVFLGGTSTSSDWKSEDVKNLCLIDENQFQVVQKEVLRDLEESFAKKNLNQLKKLISSNFQTTQWSVDLKNSTHQQDGINEFTWPKTQASKNFTNDLKNYFQQFKKIDDVEFATLSYVSTKADRNKNLEMERMFLRVRYDLRGIDQNGHRRNDRGPLEIIVVKNQAGQWAIESMNHWGLETLTIEKPRFEEITKLAGLDQVPSYKRLEAIRRGGYSISVGDINNDGLADLYIGAYGPGTLLKGLGNGKFEKVQNSGLESDPLVKTSIFADFNNNGRDDLLLVRFVPSAANEVKNDLVLYENLGDGKFKKAAHINDSSSTYQAMPATVADFNGNGLLDFYVGYPGAKDFTTLESLDQKPGVKAQGLYFNKGKLAFQTAPERSLRENDFSQTTAHQRIYPHSALAVDINQNGNMDILVIDDQGGLSPAYMNKGDGTFVQQARQIGVVNEGYGMGAAVADYNGSGIIDLALTNVNFNLFSRVNESCFANWQKKVFDVETKGLRLYQGITKGKFADVAHAVGLDYAGEGLAGAEFIDYNNDGHPDLYVANGLWSGTDKKQDLSYLFGLLTMKRERIESMIVPVRQSTGDNETQSLMMDILAGFQGDLFTEGKELLKRPHLAGFQRNRLFRNNGNGSFTEVGYLEGVDSLSDGYVIAKADLTGDGNLDLILRNGDPGSEEANFPAVQIFKNNHNTNNSLRLNLVANASNRDAIGSEVTIVANGKKQLQQLLANNGTAQSEKTLHFGLGSASHAESVTIRWPNGNTSTYRNLPAGVHEIQEVSGKLSGL